MIFLLYTNLHSKHTTKVSNIWMRLSEISDICYQMFTFSVGLNQLVEQGRYGDYRFQVRFPIMF